MKLFFLVTLLLSALSIALPVTNLASDSKDSKALARSVPNSHTASPVLLMRNSFEPRGVNNGTPGLVAALKDIYAPPFTDELFSLEDFIRHTHDRLRDKFPGANIFIYHRFQSNSRFEWGVTDPKAEEAEIQKAVGFGIEYYKVVVFRSAGVLRKSGDGGFTNWIFSGKFTREGDNVNFQAP